jgi:signal transduction histidine kinase
METGATKPHAAFGATGSYMRGVSIVVLPVLVGVLALHARTLIEHSGELVLWAACAAVGDLLLVRTGRTVTLSMSLPVTLAAAMVFSPAEAAFVSVVGCVSLEELRGRAPAHRMLFNRSQVAVAVLSAALVLQAGSKDWPAVLAWVVIALITDFTVNAGFMLPLLVREHRIPLVEAVPLLFGSRPVDTVMLYVAMGLLAPLMAVMYLSAGPAALAVTLVPAVLAHVSLARSQHLGSLLERLEAKDAAIRRATERAHAERAHERSTLASELHDEVIPALFRVQLLGQVVEKDLQEGKLLDLEDDVSRLIDAVCVAQALSRAFISGLRSSPLGSRGLSGALQMLVDDLRTTNGPRIYLSVQPPVGSHAAQQVVFLVVREALRNACQHARSTEVRVSVRHDGGMLRAVISDDGVGFEPTRTVTGHLGLCLIRETVEAVGGTLVIDSELGIGTTVAVAVPPDA